MIDEQRARPFAVRAAAQHDRAVRTARVDERLPKAPIHTEDRDDDSDYARNAVRELERIGYSGEDFPKRDDVFPVGWARRGPTGTIPTNRAESHAVAQQVLAWLDERDPKSGPDVLPIAVDAAGWHRIDKHEIAAGAAVGRPRVKLTDWQALLDVAQGG